MKKDLYCTFCGNKIEKVNLIKSRGRYYCELCGWTTRILNYRAFLKIPNYISEDAEMKHSSEN